MNIQVTDTHALIWHLENSPKLSPRAKSLFDDTDRGEKVILISAITLIEFVYLAEKGSIETHLVDKVMKLVGPGHSYDTHPVDYSVVESLRKISRSAIPDMPDRIITATAMSLGLPLITRDDRITSSGCVITIW